MLDFLDDPEAGSDEWGAWAKASPRRPLHVVRLDLSDETDRIAGTFVTPADVAMGLRPWEDADEGVKDETPWVLFDLEKLVRMMLHQSGLAFETLVAPTLHCRDGFEPRRVAQSALTDGLIDYYGDITEPLVSGSTERWRWRSLLTGALLARDAAVSVDLEKLVDALGVSELEMLMHDETPPAAVATSLRALLSERDSLPSRPNDYDWLNELVVQSRLEAMP